MFGLKPILDINILLRQLKQAAIHILQKNILPLIFNIKNSESRIELSIGLNCHWLQPVDYKLSNKLALAKKFKIPSVGVCSINRCLG